MNIIKGIKNVTMQFLLDYNQFMKHTLMVVFFLFAVVGSVLWMSNSLLPSLVIPPSLDQASALHST